MGREEWAESRQEELDENLMDYLLNSKRFLQDFLCYLEDKEPELVSRRLDEWVQTKDGKRWYDDTLSAMIADVPEMEREDLPRSER